MGLTVFDVEGENIDSECQLFKDGIAIICRNTRTLEEYALRQKRVNQGKGAGFEGLLLGLEANAIQNSCVQRGQIFNCKVGGNDGRLQAAQNSQR